MNEGGVVGTGIGTITNCFSATCGKKGKLTNILLNLLGKTTENKLPEICNAVDKIEELYKEVR